MSGLQGDPDKIEPLLRLAQDAARLVEMNASRASAMLEGLTRDGSWADGNARAALTSLEKSRQPLNAALADLRVVIAEAQGAVKRLRAAGG